MRTYDDTFSGEKIYPGKVRELESCDDDMANRWNVEHHREKDKLQLGELEC